MTPVGTLLAFPTNRHADTMPPVSTGGARRLLVRPDRDARWYNAEAVPVLRVPNKSRPGETRTVTLADARKLGLYPSVTNVLSLIANPALEAWQATSYVESALTLPRLPGETLDAFARRVVDDGEAYRDQAARDGSEIHQAIADWFQGASEGAALRARPSDFRSEYAYAGSFAPHVRAFAAWWIGSGMHCLASERRFVNREHGYGGMVDIVASTSRDPQSFEDLIIADIKTQATEPGKPVRFYDNWALQVAAYSHTPGIRLMNIVVSRTEPGRIELKEWDDGERRWACFHAALCLYKLLKNYYPGTC